MAALRPVFLVVGVLAMVAGLFFAAQGMGWIMWPAQSFMLAQSEWVVRGLLLALVGLLLVLRATVRRRRQR